MNQLSSTAPLCIWDAGRLLGEGAWWSASEQALYWLDIKRPVILRCDANGENRCEWPVPEMIGCFSPRSQGGFIGGFESGLATFDLGPPGSEIELSTVAVPEDFAAHDRFNDGKCAPDGTFWAGTMDNAEQYARGHFYRLGSAGSLTCISGPHMVCNGPAFSPDGAIGYLTDSAERTIYSLDCQSGGAPRPFITFDTQDGYPDGMTTDAAGRLWIAFWDGWKVMCVSPEGERLHEIALPVARPTSCAFGGKDMTTLFITSANIGLSENALAEQPNAGSLFACHIDKAEGWNSPAFGG